MHETDWRMGVGLVALIRMTKNAQWNVTIGRDLSVIEDTSSPVPNVSNGHVHKPIQ